MYRCRICESISFKELVNLGESTIANSFLKNLSDKKNEKKLPLRVNICDKCNLAQLSEIKDPSLIFNGDYVYYSGNSQTWKQHCKNYKIMITHKLKLTKDSHVVEIASNDGTMLKFFLNDNIKVTGVDPSTSCCFVAEKNNIHTLNNFFVKDIARKIISEKGQADLIIANNVLTHVPD